MALTLGSFCLAAGCAGLPAGGAAHPGGHQEAYGSARGGQGCGTCGLCRLQGFGHHPKGGGAFKAFGFFLKHRTLPVAALPGPHQGARGRAHSPGGNNDSKAKQRGTATGRIISVRNLTFSPGNDRLSAGPLLVHSFCLLRSAILRKIPQGAPSRHHLPSPDHSSAKVLLPLRRLSRAPHWIPATGFSPTSQRLRHSILILWADVRVCAARAETLVSASVG